LNANSQQEYFGDWNGLVNLQKTAYQMISELYTPETIMQSEMGRKISLWYLRVDFFTCVTLGAHTWIGMEWFNVYDQYYMSCLGADPDNIDLQIEGLFGKVRLYGLTTQKLRKGEVSLAKFIEQGQWIGGKIRCCYLQIKSYHPPNGPDPPQCWSISLRYLILNLLAVEMSITPTPDHPRCLKMAREQHEILEALELSPQVPAEALLPLQTSLLVACSVLPHEESHISWCQDKLARLECLGYVFLPGLSG